MKAFCSDRFVLPLRSGHRFSVQKYYLLSEGVQAELPNVLLNEAPIAADPELARWMPASSERLAFRGRGKWWNAPALCRGDDRRVSCRSGWCRSESGGRRSARRPPGAACAERRWPRETRFPRVQWRCRMRFSRGNNNRGRLRPRYRRHCRHSSSVYSACRHRIRRSARFERARYTAFGKFHLKRFETQ